MTTIRPATVEDAPAIQAVARASWHAAYGSILGASQVEKRVDSWFAPETLVTDDIEPDDRPLFVAIVDGSVVGFAEAVPVDEDTASLYRIYVAPDHWGDGIGSALLDRVETALRERGIDRLTLSVFAANDRATDFYESVGFERTETTYDDQFEVERYEYAKQL